MHNPLPKKKKYNVSKVGCLAQFLTLSSFSHSEPEIDNSSALLLTSSASALGQLEPSDSAVARQGVPGRAGPWIYK